jgi:hypothetical protein
MRIGVGLQPTGLTRGEAPGGGPILSVGSNAMFVLRLPATSDRQFGSPPKNRRERRVDKGMLFPGLQPAGRRMTPSNALPVVTKRESANDQFACQRGPREGAGLSGKSNI